MAEAISAAAAALTAGGIVGHEAEGVWGLACDPYNEQAVANLLRLKARTAAQGLILIGATAGDFDPWLQALPTATVSAIRQSWPGAVTWLLPDPTGIVPNWVRGDTTSVAARVPGRPELRSISEAFGGLLISTSANLTGEPPALTRADVERNFGARLDYIMPTSDSYLNGKSSTIINALDRQILRP